MTQWSDNQWTMITETCNEEDEFTVSLGSQTIRVKVGDRVGFRFRDGVPQLCINPPQLVRKTWRAQLFDWFMSTLKKH